jgi:hydrogenase nickel incorporation protein HypA/HybF
MHELSIALSIVEMAEEEARRRDVRIYAVHLKLGTMSGVVKEALLFSYGLACEGTRLEGSRLIIDEVPTLVYCPVCEAKRQLDSIQRFCCSVCDTPTPDVMQGRELEVVALEIQQ